MRIRHSLAAGAVLVVAAGGLAACGQATPDTSARSSSSVSRLSADHLNRSNLVRTVAESVAGAKSVHVQLTATGPLSMTAEGDVGVGASGPEASLSASVPQLGADDAQLRVVDKVLYVSVPPLTPAGKFVKLDPAALRMLPMGRRLGALSHHGDLSRRLTSMPSTVTKAISSVTDVGRQDVAGVPTEHYTVTLRHHALRGALGAQARNHPQPEGHQAAGSRTVDLWLDGSNRPRQVRFEHGGESLRLRMSQWGEDVHVSAPAAGQVVSGPSAFSGLPGLGSGHGPDEHRGSGSSSAGASSAGTTA